VGGQIFPARPKSTALKGGSGITGSAGSLKRDAPEETNRCGIFFWFRYF
jgi:hypothetical protein